MSAPQVCELSIVCHWERSEAIHELVEMKMDCFVAARLATLARPPYPVRIAMRPLCDETADDVEMIWVTGIRIFCAEGAGRVEAN